MRKRTRGYAAVVGLAALALVVAACGGSSTKTSSGSSSSSSSAEGLQGLNPGTGTPQKGGTLNMLGQGDVDYMDYNISYYTIGYLGQRPWVRGLYAYPAIPGKTTSVAPDLATGLRPTRCWGSSAPATRPSRSAACRTSRASSSATRPSAMASPRPRRPSPGSRPMSTPTRSPA
jgi:peptide/nickel transport system substrate-binding protein